MEGPGKERERLGLEGIPVERSGAPQILGFDIAWGHFDMTWPKFWHNNEGVLVILMCALEKWAPITLKVFYGYGGGWRSLAGRWGGWAGRVEGPGRGCVGWGKGLEPYICANQLLKFQQFTLIFI